MLNILNKVPKSVQPGMKEDLREVRDAPDRTTAEGAINVFVEKYQVKYSKAVECLTKDREPLLAFLDFPAEPLRSLLAAPISWIGSKACRPLMGPPAHGQPDRERVRHGSSSDAAHQRRAIAQDGKTDGLQAGHGRLENLAALEG